MALMQPVSDAARAAAGFARPSDEGGLPSLLFRREAPPPPPPAPPPLMKPALAKPSDLHRVSLQGWQCDHQVAGVQGETFKIL